MKIMTWGNLKCHISVFVHITEAERYIVYKSGVDCVVVVSCSLSVVVRCWSASMCGRILPFCFQTINMSIQSHCYLKASRSRWFAQPGGDLGNVLAFLFSGLESHCAPVPCCPSELFGHCPNFRLCSSPQSLCFTESQTFLLHFPSDRNMALQFKTSKERMSNTIPCRQLPSHSAAHTTDRRGTITVQHFVLLLWTLLLTFFCQILHFFHPHTFPLTCFLHQFVLLPLPARLKTRRRPWRRPKPTPLSLWPAWPTRSMP